jgi:hypothetical protein
MESSPKNINIKPEEEKVKKTSKNITFLNIWTIRPKIMTGDDDDNFLR